jgi:hypothetical protein
MSELTILVVIIVGLIFLFPRSRERLIERIKTFSDVVVLGLLRVTSRFGSELTEEGRAEQKLWREQRLRNLRGLALRAREAFSHQQSAVSNERERKGPADS